MKVLYPNTYLSSVSGNAATGYPVSNLDNNNTQKIWKGLTNVETVTVGATAGATAIGIANTNATSVEITTRSQLGMDWQASLEAFGIDWQAALTTFGINWVVPSESSVTEVYDISASDIGQCWAEFTTYAVGFVIEVIFTAAAGTVIQAGVIQVGIPKVYKEPQYGIQEGFRDYSIVKELNSGGFYIRKRTVARTLSFRLLEDRDVDFYEFMYQVVQVVGPGPLFWRVVHDNNTDWEWIIFALFDGGLPEGTHDHPAHSSIDISLIESI